MPVQTVPAHGPQYRRRDGDDCEHAAEMKDSRGNISFVDVASNRVCPVLENDPNGIFRFAEVLAWVDADEGARGAVFLTRVRRLFCSLWIKGCVFTQVTCNGQ